MLIEDTSGLGIIQLDNYNLPVDRDQHCLLLTDHNRWGQVQAEFDTWCAENGARREGMLVYYDDPGFIVMMKLRWM